MDTTLDLDDGVQQYVKSLARWLIKNDHEVKFLVGESKDEGEFKGKVISLSKNINIRGNANKLSTSIIPNFSKIDETINKEHFDVIHVQMPYSPFMAGVFINKTNTPIVGTFHILPANNTVRLLNKTIARGIQKQLKKISKVMSVSEAARIFAKETYGLDSAVVPNMVEVKRFRGDKLSKYNDGKINILFFGRLVKRKGAVYALKAYENLIKDIGEDRVRLIIAGDGAEKTKLLSYIERNNIPGVEMPGYIPEEEKGLYYNSADICIFPATGGESFGIVLIEAMAAGKPLVAFDNPGYKSVLYPHSKDWLAKNRDIDDLTEKLLTLIRDKELCQKVGYQNFKEVEKYDYDTVCRQIFEVYEKVIDQKEAPHF